MLSPRFFEGFSISADYWDVTVSGAIQSLSAANILNLCYLGQQATCGLIVRNSAGQLDHVTAQSLNFAKAAVKGIDLEASYRTPLSNFVSDWQGNLSFHGLMTFYLRDYANSGVSVPTESAGQNGAVPNWKLTATETYQLDPVSVSLTERAISNDVFNNAYIACTSGCPASTVNNPTYNTNFVPGRLYLDLSAQYKLDIGEGSTAEVFASARNLLNTDAPNQPALYYNPLGQVGDLYDTLGTVYRVGIRFKM